ncbi:SMI1/KNR4 family protein [Paractinoplanes ferrugineus]|nr:SMI1/KNR4 family protein [Actinoplanes ferrugineus]
MLGNHHESSDTNDGVLIDPALSTRLDRVAAKLAAAARLPGEPVMFGASAHRFELGPPLPGGEVAAFERAHGVSLPEDYRAFITKIGNGGPGRWGGAGPYYGLHPLQDWATSLWGMPEPHMLATPFPAEPGRVYSDWLSEVAPGDDDEPYRGTLALSDQGCGFLSVLVVSGPARGRITDNNDTPAGPAFTDDADFLTWYERWLDAVLAGATHFR